MADRGELPGVGDVARVVECCGCPASQHTLGTYYRVTEIIPAQARIEVVCGYCFRRNFGSLAVAIFETRGGAPRAWLRKVPPLSELESVDTVDEIESEKPRREKVEV